MSILAMMIVTVKQTTEAVKLANNVAFVVVLLACVICPLEGRVCTRVMSEKGVKTVSYPGECQQSFKAKCGWFSFEECTRNETVVCMKTRNITVTIYRIVEDCCPGYYKNRGGKCVRNGGKAQDGKGREGGEGSDPQSGVERVTSGSGGHRQVDSDANIGQNSDDDDEGFFLGISHGAYAGIVCGIMFVACIALLTAIHYRKRRLQDAKKGTVPADQEAAQRQQMISLEKMDNAASVAT